MAQVLVGHDVTGAILDFDRAGDLTDTGTKMREVLFMNFSRLLTKDEIKKQSFTLKLLPGETPVTRGLSIDQILSDYGARASFKSNSPSGEYGLLYTASANIGVSGQGNHAVGQVYYQAGICMITASLFTSSFGSAQADYSTDSIGALFTGSNITASCDGLRNCIQDIKFNNTIELNSTLYFCRVNHNEFNYSSNPTYLTASQIRVKNVASDAPISYVTTVGLYSPDNELMAVAKLSEPLKKDPSNEFTLRVRLDY